MQEGTANPQSSPDNPLPSALNAGVGRPDEKECESTETDNEVSDRSSTWLAWLAALPIVYVLSIGPVALIAKNNPPETAVLRKVYAPVIWLHENTPLRKPLEMYVSLFGVR
jgi:hypothetical protein